MSRPLIDHIALIGNPNSGKTTIFNYLTGLSQRTGNFPGITVDKKSAVLTDDQDQSITISDLPGTYSLYPTAKDDLVVVDALLHPDPAICPNRIIYVADVTSLKKQLLLLTQIMDLGIPVRLVLSMAEYRSTDEVTQIIKNLKKLINIPILAVSVRQNINLDRLSQWIKDSDTWSAANPIFTPTTDDIKTARSINQQLNNNKSDFYNLLIARHYNDVSFLSASDRKRIAQTNDFNDYQPIQTEVYEIMARYDQLDRLDFTTHNAKLTKQQRTTSTIDSIVTHPIFGPMIFIAIMTLMFQAVYTWSGLPMEWIESIFTWSSAKVAAIGGDFWLTDLIANGLIAGLGGIVIFAPQIAILFLLIALLEESGYMSRVVYIFDPLMRKFGLNGRSLIAMISSGACAVPAIMSTRTIKSEKARLNTILTAPLVSCSARLPVYTVLIGLMVPDKSIGIFNAQGLAFMGVYLLSIISTLVAAYIIKLFIGINKNSGFLIELPLYRVPVWRDIWLSVWSKVKIFLVEAGKIILIISLILWFLASYGPGDHKLKASQAITTTDYPNITDYADALAAKELEYSYIGYIGKTIEPVIRPLGYDWKIGIALITSFAAREVFVGTMATIYSIGSSNNEASIRERMRAEVNPRTGLPVYSFATSLSLLIFYLYAMQCMSTVAVVKRETGGWRWPIIQFTYMTVLAVIGAFLVYQILS